MTRQATRVETAEIYALAEERGGGRWRVEFEDADVLKPTLEANAAEEAHLRRLRGDAHVEALIRAERARYEDAKESGRRTLVVPHMHDKGVAPLTTTSGATGSGGAVVPTPAAMSNAQYGRAPLPSEVDARMLDWDDDLAFSRAASDAFRNNQTKVYF